LINKQNSKSKQAPVAQPKELTARERALEFAKHNVPKPKQRRADSATRENEG